jgi:acyl-CoA reductase-like NAD-dependent aldehyde dehydrogenase
VLSSQSRSARASVSSINPATGATLEEFSLHTAVEIDAVLTRARSAQREWARRSYDARSIILHAVGAKLRAEAATLARHITREMGKPIIDAEAEIEKCAWVCDFYAEHAARFLADELTPTNAAESYVAYRPLGVLLAIMPWNFPFFQVFRFAAPALMAGNAGVLKHASNVSRCALEIERIFHGAGLPDGVFSTVLVPGAEVSHLIADDRIAAITLTGSEPAGVSVASASGRALKKTVLELGGSDAFIVLADADVAAAAKVGARARFQNAGQSCICAKRFIVEEAVYDDFIDAFVAEVQTYRIGDPEDRSTTMGPLARGDLRDDLMRQIHDSTERGARCILGGKPTPGPGFFFDPTIVIDVADTMSLFREETFGPVAAVTRADDSDHAIALANDSIFGLGGALWTKDIARAKSLAAQIESGAVFINGMTASDPRLPFGGVKHSGYGRELSYFGIREFMNVQSIWIGPASS